MGNIDLTERIRQRAYEIWESEGQPRDRNLIHWLRAEAEIRDALKARASTGTLPAPTSKAPRKRAPSSKPAAKPPQRQPPNR